MKNQTKLHMKKTPPAHVSWGVANSPAGKLVIGLTEQSEICRIAFLRGRKPAEAVAEWRTEWPRATFTGDAKVENFARLPVAMVGTAFQQSVWKAMAKIPAGRTMSYGGLAARIGKPKASRAVGAACGANPVPYLVPCHRVVAANGGLGGFSGGLDVKQKLLKAEGSL
jgi:O-6-methylguanine DNA methyltransferase